MASTLKFGEDYGTPVGSPNRGANRVFDVTNVNWKNYADVSTPYTDYPITAGENSYNKYTFCYFTGTFNKITNCVVGHTTGTFDAGITLLLKAGTDYAEPSTTTLVGAVDVTIPSGITEAYQTLTLGTSGPESASSSELTATGYSCYWQTQLCTTESAQAGDTATATFTVKYSES